MDKKDREILRLTLKARKSSPVAELPPPPMPGDNLSIHRYNGSPVQNEADRALDKIVSPRPRW